MLYRVRFGVVIYYIWIERCRKFYDGFSKDIYYNVFKIKEEIGFLIGEYIGRKKCNMELLCKFSL